jgi:hypothetical protein
LFAFGFEQDIVEKLISFGLNVTMLMPGASAVFGGLQLRANAARRPVAARKQYKH